MENILGNGASFSIDLLSLGLGGIIGVLFITLIAIGFSIKNRSEKSALYAQIEGLEANQQALQGELGIVREKLMRANEDSVRFQVEKESLKKHHEQSKIEFENLANKIFEEKTQSFKHQSKEDLNLLLSPLKDRLNDFQKKVDDSFSTQKAEQSSLKEHIRMIVETHESSKVKVENLTNALTRDTKAQGNWGEVILEKILEDAGLKKDINYTIQATGLGIKHVETGNTLKPDVIVNLPDNKHIIVDSKVSLTNYERYCSLEESDEGAADEALKLFLASMRKHVKDLEKRRYQDTEKLGTPDFVLMFVPVEGAYMLALQKDPDLHQFAWDKGVVLVGTSTLFSTLRTVESLWRLVNQNNNALEIARQGGALYEKVAGFVDDMKKIGSNMQTLDRSYQSAMNKLSEGRGNILKRTEMMKTLGAQTSKSLPQELIEPIDKSDEALLEKSTEKKNKAA
ncbi:MAG: DNA recombination protein RmuC [Pseudomonadota bacterium]